LSLDDLSWAAFDDTLEGGKSRAEIRPLSSGTVAGRHSLLVSGYIRDGIDYPLAGAKLSLLPGRFIELRFKARGQGRKCQIGLLTRSKGRKPALREFVLSSEWTQYTFRLSDFGLVNTSEVTGILFSVGPDPGPFAFQVDDVRIARLGRLTL